MVQNNARFCSMCSLPKCRLFKQSKPESDIVLLENTLPEVQEVEKERQGTCSENSLPDSFFNLDGTPSVDTEMPIPRYCF